MLGCIDNNLAGNTSLAHAGIYAHAECLEHDEAGRMRLPAGCNCMENLTHIRYINVTTMHYHFSFMFILLI
jgi:hypothetical protein